MIEQIKKRRSHYPKTMTGEIIPDDVIWKALEAAQTAPTHKTTQPWQFIVFDKKNISKLTDKQKEIFQLKNMDNKPVPPSFGIVENNVSHIVVIVCNITGLVPEVEEICATAAAVQNFALALSMEGFGGYWSTGNGIFDPKMHELLELTNSQKLLGYFYCGVHDGSELAPRKRNPISENVDWIK